MRGGRAPGGSSARPRSGRRLAATARRTRSTPPRDPRRYRLRIGEALALERRDVDLAKATLWIGRSKTEAGVRTVDLAPALRGELAAYLERSPWKQPTDRLFPTLAGVPDNRQNVRRRLLLPAIERANAKLAELEIDPIGKVTLHGLRRTYASLRCAVGDDQAYVADQLGHADPAFTMRVYTHAVTRRQRLAGAELEAFTRAMEWAQWAPVPATVPIETARSRAA